MFQIAPRVFKCAEILSNVAKIFHQLSVVLAAESQSESIILHEKFKCLEKMFVKSYNLIIKIRY